MIVADMALNARQIRFCNEYLIDFNGTKAAIRAGYSTEGAPTQAFRLLSDVEIFERIERRKLEIAALAEVDASWIVKQWRDIAEADPNDLIQFQRVCCRFCWGVDHHFQWTEREYSHAVLVAVHAKDPQPPPDGLGGFGFDATREPCEECPECHGDGVENIYISDTRHLKGPARRLYAGLKKTKDGIEIKMRDQDAALLNLAKYVGMIVDKKEVSGPNGGAIPIANLTAADLTDDQLAAIALGEASV